ncbi:MAG: universal stress protein [Rhodocyclaceae bacterium]|nr:universal stress protein [Rhodocyclaceae bacterium]
MYRHILVPVEGTDLSIDTVSKAVEFAKKIGARITFVHARSDFGATDGGALVHAMSPKDYAQQEAGSARAILAKGEVEAQTFGVPYQSIAKTSDRPYEVIIDTAEEQDCDLIFMASHGKRGLKGLFVGSQTQKVLAHTTIPVLVSSVESNATSPEMNAAISAIKGEHRSLAAVIKGLQHVLEQARVTQLPLNARLLRAMILYFRRFTQELHHPKEEEYLFARLRGKSAEADKVIGTLEIQHVAEPTIIAAIEAAVDIYLAAPNAVNLGSLTLSVEKYADHIWGHMTLEEKEILPDCRRHFTTSDWKEIANAFLENGDPRFDKDRDADFDKFFERIMNLADIG